MTRRIAAVVVLALALALLCARTGPGRARPLRAQAAATIALAPDSGPPGTIVTISGFVDGVSAEAAAAPDQASRSVDVCWNACPGGLSYDAVPVQWSTDDPGAFSLSFVVPAVLWLQTDGVHRPAPGAYTVGLQCLTPPGTRIVGGCAVGPAVATAIFTLTAAAPAACPNDGCATIQLSPSEAAPGTLVQVSGSAPLAQNIGDGDVCCWDLVLEAGTGGPVELASLQQTPDGMVMGSFRVPLTAPSAGQLAPQQYRIDLQTGLDGDTGVAAGVPIVSSPTLTIVSRGPSFAQATIAVATFTLDAAPAWSSLPQTTPLLVQRSTPLAGAAISAADGAGDRLAACVLGAIAISDDGGATWRTAPIDAALQPIADAGYTAFPSDGDAPPTCLDVTRDAANPDSLFATFQAAKQPYGAPPLFHLGLISVDDGASWQIVPPPDGDTPDGFGGFAVSSDGVEALFGHLAQDQASTAVDVETTSDGGRSWNTAALSCPASGPCVRWGAAANATGSCAMHAYPQPILVSDDGGASFAANGWPASANGCDSAELVALSPSTVLLLSGRDPFPAAISTDGGASWQALALPPLPATAGAPGWYPDLQILANGALLAHGDDGWYQLSAGADGWCSLNPALLPPDVATVWALGDGVWWLPNAAAMPVGVAAGALTCADS